MDRMTRIVSEWFRNDDLFASMIQEDINTMREKGRTEEAIAKTVGITMLMCAHRGMKGVMAPSYSHEILLHAFGEIDWAAAAHAAFLIDPELN